MTEKVVWHVVKDCAKQAAMEKRRPMIFAAHARGFAMRLAVSLTRFNFFSGTFLFGRPRSILGASSAFRAL